MKIEIAFRKNGKPLARRTDGKPLTDDDRQEAKRLIAAQQADQIGACVVREEHSMATGALQAVQICSKVVEAHLWLVFDKNFDPADGLAIFYPEELAFLRDKSPDSLRDVHQIKLTFGKDARVVQ